MSSPGETATDTLISEAMRGVLGQTLETRTSFPIAASDIRKWAIAVYFPERPPPQFLGAGATGGEAPLIAPEDFNPFAWATPGPEPKRADISPGFLERLAGIAPPAVEFMVNGGIVCDYGAPMVEGDVITTHMSVKSYVQKQGKRGPLLITGIQNRWTNQRGDLVRNQVLTLVRY